MALHSSLGASSAKRWMTCPASWRLCEEAPPQPTSPYAAAGSVAHGLAEWCLAGPDRVPELRDGEFVPHHGYVVLIDAEMIRTVGTYLRAVRERIEPGCVVRHETLVSLAPWWAADEPPPPAPLFGTADSFVYSRRTRRLVVLDFKYGSGVFVNVRDNPQLLYYAAGVLAWLDAPVREVETVVVQPRAAGMAPVRSDAMDALDLRRWIDFTLKPAVARVTDPDAELVPGPHCRFCAARPTCPAYAVTAQDSARQDFEDMSGLLGLSV